MIIAKVEAMKAARLEKGWNCKRLAEEAGISTGQCITRIERGASTSPKTAKQIADALGHPVSELFAIK